MKIIYILDMRSYHIASMNFFMCEMCTQLGQDFVMAFTQEPTPLLKAFFKENGCHYIVVKKTHWNLFKVAVQYDKVLTGFFRLNTFLVLMLALFRARYIFVNHSSYLDSQLIENQNGISRFLKKIKCKIISIPISKIICVSNYCLNELFKAGFPKNKLTCIYNGVSTYQQMKLANQHIDAPQIDGMEKGKNRIKCIYVGSLELFKGVDIILATASQMPHIDFYIAGDGSLKDAVEKSAKSASNIIYLGVIQNFMLIANQFDFTIIPSRWNEAFCYTAIEAVYSKLPIIASTKGALPEVLKGGPAIFMKSLDASALQDAIQQVLIHITDTTWGSHMNPTFTIDNQTKAYVQLLRS